MKEKLNALLGKVKANKDVIIRVGVAVGVAAIGAGAVALAIHMKNERDQVLIEEVEFTDEEDVEENGEEDDEETDE
jgi:hypothetical protein